MSFYKRRSIFGNLATISAHSKLNGARNFRFQGTYVASHPKNHKSTKGRFVADRGPLGPTEAQFLSPTTEIKLFSSKIQANNNFPKARNFTCFVYRRSPISGAYEWGTTQIRKNLLRRIVHKYRQFKVEKPLAAHFPAIFRPQESLTGSAGSAARRNLRFPRSRDLGPGR